MISDESGRDDTIFSPFKELMSVDFSVSGVTAKAEIWADGCGVDNLEQGRSKNLIHIVTQGSRGYIVADRRFSVDTGEVLFIPDGTKYATWAEGVCAGIGVCFDLSGETANLAPDVYHDWSDERGDYLKLFTRLHDSFLTDFRAVLHRKALLLRILDHLSADESPDAHLGELLSPALGYIAGHFSENCPVSRYAKECRLSESYFRRKFLEHTGMTPIEYRNQLRFDEAKRLRASGMNITDVAEAVGFCDASYFRRIYKQCKGLSIRDDVASEII